MARKCAFSHAILTAVRMSEPSSVDSWGPALQLGISQCTSFHDFGVSSVHHTKAQRRPDMDMELAKSVVCIYVLSAIVLL